MLRMIAVALVGLSALSDQVALADGLDLTGRWRCTVNADTPKALTETYSYDIQLVAEPNGAFSAGGTVVRPGHPVPITRVKGRGKWQIVERDAKGTRPLVEFRLKQPGEPDITWVARPAGRGAMYHRTRDGSGDTVLDIEAACGKLG